ncbi:hypothetical protein Pelo_17173 [Pelomyxa schiedti]|nr:hypothetical protein Pelo_17173 [Pelomyxa schiedti]
MQLHVRLASGRQISVNFDGEFARVYDVATYIKLYEGINDDEVAFCRGGRWLAFDEVLHNHDDLDITFRYTAL